MTTIDQDLHSDVHPGRQWVALVLAAGLCVPGVVLKFGSFDLSHPLQALVFGLAIVGAAFLLSWAAEVAQLDISAGLAIAVLAFIAVLPEYAVDFVFAREGRQRLRGVRQHVRPAGADAESRPCSLALANMTGANRLLIGIGWTMVVFIAWWRMRAASAGRPHARRGRPSSARTRSSWPTSPSRRAYSLTLPFKRSITLFDAAVLVSIFIAYTIRISTGPGGGAPPGRPGALDRQLPDRAAPGRGRSGCSSSPRT